MGRASRRKRERRIAKRRESPSLADWIGRDPVPRSEAFKDAVNQLAANMNRYGATPDFAIVDGVVVTKAETGA